MRSAAGAAFVVFRRPGSTARIDNCVSTEMPKIDRYDKHRYGCYYVLVCAYSCLRIDGVTLLCDGGWAVGGRVYSYECADDTSWTRKLCAAAVGHCRIELA